MRSNCSRRCARRTGVPHPAAHTWRTAPRQSRICTLRQTTTAAHTDDRPLQHDYPPHGVFWLARACCRFFICARTLAERRSSSLLLRLCAGCSVRFASARRRRRSRRRRSTSPPRPRLRSPRSRRPAVSRPSRRPPPDKRFISAVDVDPPTRCLPDVRTRKRGSVCIEALRDGMRRQRRRPSCRHARAARTSPRWKPLACSSRETES